MAFILLPSSPLPQSANPKPIDYGMWQQPIAGGTTTRLDRFGNRFSMDVVLPRLKPEPDGRIWVARLLQAINQDVQLAFPQMGLNIGVPGAPVVDGPGQGGLALAIRGFSAGYHVREGQFFSFVDAGGRPYLEMSTADVVADSAGKAVVPLYPMLRTSPSDGIALNFAAPVIVGQLSGNENGWTLERAGTRGLQFTITERK
ncbi:hypothetical protein [Sphingomonas nostoxanthinifaciens]|uniref:hypothetical protein n=1 Tax=Sphingomonas nostoxanthinifaciens TaxID=2872652 RepID=UPI001CC20D8D|nr:hypothetical protein [Sphingomonas nostoxanthinifaciens]UAK24180.1 hypothetical protein K8P63_17915 [Sphingomonas nostoxanthinifaciens]